MTVVWAMSRIFPTLSLLRTLLLLLLLASTRPVDGLRGYAIGLTDFVTQFLIAAHFWNSAECYALHLQKTYSSFPLKHKLGNVGIFCTISNENILEVVTSAVADLHSNILTPRPNSFNFMQFLGKFRKIVCWRPWEGWRPHLGEILDPSLQWNQFAANLHLLWCFELKLTRLIIISI